jgi:hypothetical protein
LADKPKEEWSTLFHPLQAHVGCPIILRLFSRHAPSKVNVNQVNSMALQPFAQSRENTQDQLIAFCLHVAKRGRNEHAGDAPTCPFIGQVIL